MKIYKIIAIITLVFTVPSCNDYLDLSPISEETSANAYKNASQVESALIGAYESFQSSDYYVWDNILFQDVRADNHYAGGDNPEIFSIDYLTVSTTNSKVYGSWSNLYNAIAKANTVIERAKEVTDIKMTEERRNQIIGEAYFLRAFHYYNLVKNWGGVPLVLESVKSADPEVVRIPRATEEEVYAQIISDLELSASLLPDTYGNDASVNKARVSSGAANALGAKACLQKPNPDYIQALSFIAKVEESTANYTLINYEHLFDGNHYNNDESILEIQYLGGDEGNWGPQMLLPPSISGDTWRKFVTPSQNLVKAFDVAGDVIRKNATVLFESVDWIDEYWGNEIGHSIPFGSKWKNANGWSSSDRQYLLRYGDVILLKAEALNETGQLELAADEVNKIRSRVYLPNLTSDQKSTKEILRTTILNERRLELAQEAQRWDDLVRYNVIVETMNNLVEIDLRAGTAVNYNMTEAKILLPIPQQELDRNPALVQNPL